VNANAQFGFSLATGDINDDSRSDLAIGSPGEDIPAVGNGAATSNAGAVHVLLGSASRLSATGNQIFHENTTGITVTPASGDRFGETVVFGRMNSDRPDDLAIGAPGAGVSNQSAAGEVRILYSTGTALGTTGSQLLNQNTSGVVGNGALQAEKFGSSFAVGDFNDDGHWDLAVETPGEKDAGAAPGTANILFGNSTGNGIGTTGNQIWLSGTQKLQQSNITETEAERNTRLGNQFLDNNKNQPGVNTTSSGLQYKILSSGDPNGSLGTSSSQYTVKYTGTHLDGSIFDSSDFHGGTGTFTPGGVVSGFGEALLLMRPGDHWTVFIPGNLAYGSSGNANAGIGPNETLIFDLQIVSIA